MNSEIIRQMISPYVKENELTYNDFEKIFEMLSLREQYDVINAIEGAGISLVDEYQGKEESDEEIEITDDEANYLYDDSIFQDDNTAKNQEEQIIFARKDVKQSNNVLLHEIKQGNKQALSDFCTKNERLVYKYVMKYKNVFRNKLDVDDLFQVGMMGMIKAIERFDFRGEFSTYAVYWIRQSILREIMNNGFTVRLPVHVIEAIMKVAKIDAKYAEERNYEDRVKAIAKELNMPLKKVDELLALRSIYMSDISLDMPIGEEKETILLEIIPYEREESLEEQVAGDMLHDALQETMADLTQREEQILRLRFGFDDGKARTLEEIGKIFGVTRERIRQIEEKALRKLRYPVRSNKFKDFRQ